MLENSAPPTCPKCRKCMLFLLRKDIGGRKFQCLDCEGDDPLKSNALKWISGELKPPE